ncbi:F0F1 ATP synthase subunit B family protein [Desulfogranum mediterraneum]|uniref:F0F1 ATP synthase subunit B family protein n=1 Tax=Desulfogranum mediterraneum TaxID=160661 RepID=UPI0009FE1061|nr:ATP synthase F0 subunit B [Desulfogranum mediterraneum]
MKSRIIGVIGPVLLLLLLAGATAVVASSASSEGHKQAAAHVEAAAESHGETAAQPQDAHGAPAPEAHGAAADAHGAAGHGAVSGSLSPEKLKDLFWRTVNFIALVILLVKFLGKPIVSGLGGRQKEIREELDELAFKRDQAQSEYTAFEAKLAGMEQEMEKVVEKAIAQAETEKARILSEAEQAAADIKLQAQAAVQGELEDAKRQLRDEVAEQAAAMAEELIVKNLTPADQVTITEQFLERVGAVQ